MADKDELEPLKTKPLEPTNTGIVSSVADQTVDSQPDMQDQQTLAPPPKEAPVSNTVDQPNITPVQGELNPETDTVEGRLNVLTASGSKYIEQAKEDAAREANTRGLINSSMAAGAGEEAAIRAALPIAQQDAQQYADMTTLNVNTQNEFLKNEQSAALNKELASFENLLAMEKEAFSIELQKDLELFMNDAKFSDEMKLQIVSTMNTVIQDAQAQIVEIGMSDRSAEQQAQAIQMVQDNRDATLETYQTLLESFDDWDWGTDFTPDQTTTASVNNNWNAPGGVKLVEEPRRGTIIDGQEYQGNGVWTPYVEPRTNEWS